MKKKQWKTRKSKEQIRKRKENQNATNKMEKQPHKSKESQRTNKVNTLEWNQEVKTRGARKGKDKKRKIDEQIKQTNKKI